MNLQEWIVVETDGLYEAGYISDLLHDLASTVSNRAYGRDDQVEEGLIELLEKEIPGTSPVEHVQIGDIALIRQPKKV